MQITKRQIGNSQGFVIPKPVLAQVGLDTCDSAELVVHDGALLLRKPLPKRRQGWAAAAKKIAQAGEDALVLGEFANQDDDQHSW